MNYILYQAYGKKEVKHECRFALLHLLTLHYSNNICPIIYTDDPLFFKEVLHHFRQHEIEILTTEQIKKWKGGIDFVHRVKIEIINHFFSKHTGNLLYCDTDTYFLESPEAIFKNIAEGKLYMHMMEGYINKLSDPQFKKWEKFLVGNSSIISPCNKSAVNKIQMWNAGVIGLQSAKKHLLEEVLHLTDKTYKQFPKHIAEQFAFCYIFQREGNISEAAPYIFHYWYLKEFAPYLEKLFETK